MTVVVDEPLVITQPGVYDIAADVYHADPVARGSLSASGAKDLLPPSCPAKYRYKRDNGQAPKRIFELGHAAHALVLGTGSELVLVDRPRWDTNEVKAELAEIRDRGAVPLKRDEWDQVHAMADALRKHTDAAALFAPGSGRAEQSLFWVHEASGVWRRARLDWLPHQTLGRMIVPDYKTCVSADHDALQKVIYNLGYHRAAAWYVDAVLALGMASQAAFVLVFQEKEPPYLVHVVEPDQTALRIGRDENRVALHVFAECIRTGVWPGYADDVSLISLPPWVEARYNQETYR